MDGIRALISKKVAELDAFDGYLIVSPKIPDPKGKAVERSDPMVGSAFMNSCSAELSPTHPSRAGPPRVFTAPHRPPPLSSLARRSPSTVATTVSAVPTHPSPAVFSSSSPTVSIRTLQPQTPRGNSSSNYSSSTSGQAKTARREIARVSSSAQLGQGTSGTSGSVGEIQQAWNTLVYMNPPQDHAGHRRTSSTSASEGSGWSTDRSASPLLTRTSPLATVRRLEGLSISGRGAPEDDQPGANDILDLADFIRNSGPELIPPPSTRHIAPIDPPRLIARPEVSLADEEAGLAELTDFLRAGPPPSPELPGEGAPLMSSPSEHSASGGTSTSPGRGTNKRWTMNGVTSLFRSPLLGSQSPTFSSTSPVLPLPQPLPSPPPSPRQPVLRDSKISPLGHLAEPVSEPSGLPDLGQSIGANAGQLAYVKLAKTKGARLIRAVETVNRTYLAVLAGEAGERIELFTVSIIPVNLRECY